MAKHRKKPNRETPTYAIGYGRPPKDTRFKPGESGNQRGRPRKLKTVFQEIDEIFMETVAVSVNGRQRKITRQAVMFRSLMNEAMHGSVRAADFLIRQRETYRDRADTVISATELSPEDRALLEDFIHTSAAELADAKPKQADDDGGGND